MASLRQEWTSHHLKIWVVRQLGIPPCRRQLAHMSRTGVRLVHCRSMCAGLDVGDYSLQNESWMPDLQGSRYAIQKSVDKRYRNG